MDTELLQQVQVLVGKRFEYLGRACTVIELLDRENALILRCEDSQRSIQGNQFGEATRRAQEYHTLVLFEEDNTLNPLIEHWLESSGTP